MQEYRNEFLDGLVGRAALVTQLTGPELDEEFANRINEDPLNVRQQFLQSRTAMLEVVSYDQLGILFRTMGDDPFETFVPWGAVIQLARLGPEETEGYWD
jgi:hypothetical protein